MQAALRHSLNVVTAQWMNTLKPGPVIGLARRMGLAGAMPADVTPLELARAYAPLANGGCAVRSTAVLRVLDRHGTVIAAQEPDGHVAWPRVLRSS